MGISSAGCSIEDQSTSDSSTVGSTGLAGRIHIDGSSTLAPISEAVAEDFLMHHPRIQPLVGASGTGGGFKKFLLGETDINNASRPITAEEVAACKKNGIEFIELKVAIDGLSVAVHPENTWCDCLSVAQLKAIWEKDSRIRKWSDLNTGWPSEEIKLYGPDTESGTFDFFTKEVCGESGNIRNDYTPSANDNVLVQGVSGDPYSLGYFGYAYYAENKDKLKVLGISAEGSESCVRPTAETIESGKYAPLSRPLLLYVNRRSLKRPEVAGFVEFYLNEGQELVEEVGYVRLSADAVAGSRQELDRALSKSP